VLSSPCSIEVARFFFILGHRPILEKKIFGSRSPPFGHPLGLSLLLDLLMEKKGQKSEPSTVRWTGETKDGGAAYRQ
jgi:hypothetical protein